MIDMLFVRGEEVRSGGTEERCWEGVGRVAGHGEVNVPA